jgi:hypothetical protein
MLKKQVFLHKNDKIITILHQIPRAAARDF